MNIGEAAKASGVSAKMIRHYEAGGLVPRAARTGAGYRRYGSADVQWLVFIRRARAVGYSLDEIRSLLLLWRDRGRSAADLKRLAVEHLEDIEARIAGLQLIAASLSDLVARSQGDDRPEYPRLDPSAGTASGDGSPPTP